MKLTIPLLLLGAVSTVNGLSECILNCQAEAAASDCSTSNYNQTSCYCNNGDFPIDVQSCLEKSCSNDIGSFHTYRGSQCGGSSATTTATAAASTSTITLSSCILECQSTAADTVGGVCSSSSYNNTACYCDSDSFATQTQDCIFSDCAGQDGTFHQWRGSICASSTTTSSSTSAATSTSSSSGSSGLSKGAIAGISVGSAVAGIAIISLIVFTLLRRRWKATNTYNKDSDPKNFPLHKLASASTSVA
ncbi:CFEM domain-containing protein [Aspergillus niger CBS 101883]|uniref:CFEM domain-containing protein n=1 Tax=Aspergillus niger ATCC 13496 TaxID=1353008 RepID=A0A370BRZ2_ASPNG|nr:uncharacterized protein BO96DRAFT_473932 [Aspergillus niger CBS 101883]PYH57405.1 hypothetical protein BO96DRAFT_473932 [Aspergillus niger CBS 101883]RDH16875.1 hypothetical protein M747DRAFT_344905 [Aspergillus niger ATCC 13496]